jgi:hypothetical protein
MIIALLSRLRKNLKAIVNEMGPDEREEVNHAGRLDGLLPRTASTGLSLARA